MMNQANMSTWWRNFDVTKPPMTSPEPPKMHGGPADVKAPPVESRRMTEIGDYFVGPQICEGSYGMVRQAVKKVDARRADETDGDVTVYAMKIIEISRYQSSETTLQQRIRHPNVARILNSFIADGMAFIIMEYCRGGDVFEYVNRTGRIPEERGRELFYQMLASVAIMHKHQIAHHDIKLENFLLTADLQRVKVSDFGAAEELGRDGLSSRFKGQVCAPEKTQSGELYNAYGADVFQLGKLLHELHCMLRPPTPWGTINIPPPMKMNGFHPSPYLTDLICSMVQADPTRRPSLTDVAKHPWLRQCPPLRITPKVLYPTRADQEEGSGEGADDGLSTMTEPPTPLTVCSAGAAEFVLPSPTTGGSGGDCASTIAEPPTPASPAASDFASADVQRVHEASEPQIDKIRSAQMA